MPTMDGWHRLDSRLLSKAVKVVVIGAGGTGSHVVADLAVLHQSMLDLGHPHGLDVTVVDDDCVSAANVGRARYFACDVGARKAQTIVNRVNIAYGLMFKAVNQRLERYSDRSSVLTGAHIVIGCVDTRESRRSIHACLNDKGFHRSEGGRTYWMDLGNGEHDGQVLLGEVGDAPGTRLPCISDLYPEILKPESDPVDAGPSCSRAEALSRQSAFVNKSCAMHAVSMLSMLFRHGRLDHCGVFFNLLTGRASVLPCDPEAWQRFGYSPLTLVEKRQETAESP